MWKRNTIYACALAILSVAFCSCKKEYEDIAVTDDAKIQEYIRSNNIQAVKDPSGFYYQIVSQGEGERLKLSDSVIFDFNYKGLNGEVFYTLPVYTNAGTYVGYVSSEQSGIYPKEAFRTALSAINRGGKLRLIIPSYLAFGKNGNQIIPSNQVLVSEISTYIDANQTAVDDKRIAAYLQEKGITATRHSSGVYYRITQQGTGTLPIDITTNISAKYTGRLLDGTVISQTGDQAASYKLGTLPVPGARQVLAGFTKGTKVQLFVPSPLAYGASGSASVPANSCVDFEVEIVDVTE